MFEDEVWRNIAEFPHYLVSTHGRVKQEDAVAPRKVTVNNQGTLVLVLYGDDSQSRYLRQVSHLVLLAFEGHAPEGQTSAWHIDGDRTNCHIDNLTWSSRGRVLEWNEMHRTGEPKLKTPRVKNNRTGMVYESAFHCALDEGRTESEVVFDVERRSSHVLDPNAPYRYLGRDE